MDIKNKIANFKDIMASDKYALTPYIVNGNDPKPFALILPGGGYGIIMSSVEGEPYAKRINEMGYNAFVLRYGIKKRARYPIPLEDVARALRYIRTNAKRFNVLKDEYAIWGSSAGGHLAAMFATKTLGYEYYQLPKPTCLILCYPVVSAMVATHIPSIDMIIGLKWTDDKKKMVSVECNMDKDFPPTFIWNSLEDDVVPPINSILLDQKCDQLGIIHEYHQFTHGHHGKGLKENSEWFDFAMRFWKSNMKKASND